jgi:hypothetical protein
MNMKIRDKEMYLSTDVWKACLLLAKSRGTITDAQGLSRTVTADEIANELLFAIIAKEYPQISEHLSRVKKLETEIVETLGGGKT